MIRTVDVESYLTSQAQGRLVGETRVGARRVALEGPPLFFRPAEHFPAQSWRSMQFHRGWELADALQRVARTATQASHWVLIDDVNNCPTGRDGLSAQGVMEEIFAAQPDLRDVRLLRGIPSDFINHRGSWESDLVRRIRNMRPYLDRRSSLPRADGYFQADKLMTSLINQQTQNGQLPELAQDNQEGNALRVLDMRGLPLLVVVHPTEFGRQQQHTMEGLLGAVRQDARFPQLVGRLSRQSRIELISRSYLHVWVDSSGEIASLTHPAWNTGQQRFQHQEIEL